MRKDISLVLMDIEKSSKTGPQGKLNTSKLIKKPIQVVGKNGQTFTRMQWVKPHEVEEPKDISVQEEPSTDTKIVGNEPIEDIKLTEEAEDPELFIDNVQSRKKIDPNTQSGFIETLLKKMSREDKYNMIDNFEIDWEENEHDNINHMNAMVALRNFMLENPEKFGAGHLPTDSTYPKTPDQTDIINEFYDKIKKDADLMYSLLKEVGIGTGQDPRVKGDPKTNIIHMKFIREFKKYLKEHPEFMEDERWNVSGDIKKPKKPTKQTKAEQGGNTIEGIMGTMSEEDKFAYIRFLGISDLDLTAVDPATRMELLKKLKVHIIMNPGVLNIDPHTGGESSTETTRKENLTPDEDTKEKVDEFFRTLLKSTKEMLIDEYEHLEVMKNRKRNANENIDYMNSVRVLKEHFMKNPKLLREHRGDLEDDELSQLKITNKQMEKILRHVAGIKGSYDVKIEDKQDGRTVQWGFLDDFAEIKRDEYGNWVLAITRLNEDEVHESEFFDLGEISDYVKGLDGKGVPLKKEIPLHKQSIDFIQKALNDNVNSYTDKVGKVLAPWLYDIWRNEAGRDSSIASLSNGKIISTTTLTDVLEKMGMDSQGGFMQYGDKWNKVFLSHLIEGKKTKNALDYFVEDEIGDNNAYVFIESAKKWTSEEKDEARDEFVDKILTLPDFLQDDPKGDRIANKVKEHTKNTLTFAPLDIFSEMVADGLNIDFPETVTEVTMVDGRREWKEVEFNWAHYQAGSKRIQMSPHWIRDSSIFGGTPVSTTPYSNGGYKFHTYGKTLSHEFAHAVDNFLSRDNTTGARFLDWEGARGEKYVGEEYSKENPVNTSYVNAVKTSNPSKELGFVKDDNGNIEYAYHKDNWLRSYEGRIYTEGYSDLSSGIIGTTPEGRYVDNDFTEKGGGLRGLEHWSESLSHYATAHMSYKASESDLSFDSWLEDATAEYEELQYSDNENSDSYGNIYSSAYNYSNLKRRFPHITQAINDIFNRGDFIDVKSPSFTEQMEQTHIHDTTPMRKSETVSLYIGGEGNA